MAFHHAQRTCMTCGKRIVIYRPKHEGEKQPHERTGQLVRWEDFQAERVVRCQPCARKIARAFVAKLQARIGTIEDE